MVVLTLASSQFGPRLLRNFMYNRLNQIVLGMYVSTYIYCLIVLNAVKGNDNFSFVPSISILMAIILAIVCIIFLIFFIHQVSMSIQPSYVINSIRSELDKNIKETFSNQNSKVQVNIDEIIPEIEQNLKVRISVTNIQDGYLQYIDFSPLLSIAKENNLLIKIKIKPGTYLVKGALLAEISSAGPSEEKMISKIQSSFVTAHIKTTFQDAEFAIDQIVEIACKALSPGINDPFTAITCIDNLSAIMCDLAQRQFPEKYFLDDEDKLRIITHPLHFPGLIDAAFNQIRQYGASSPSVLIRLMEVLNTIHQFCRTDEQRQSVKFHLLKVLESGKCTFSIEEDITDLKERYYGLSSLN
ncbi:MAG: DUF2254 domain-containing protein [Saprospiraceae bacterium]|nr:DUF2254 domain-containing protein [Saprospiraceae bacterium]